jgi:hypothetical protein
MKFSMDRDGASIKIPRSELGELVDIGGSSDAFEIPKIGDSISKTPSSGIPKIGDSVSNTSGSPRGLPNPFL